MHAQTGILILDWYHDNGLKLVINSWRYGEAIVRKRCATGNKLKLSVTLGGCNYGGDRKIKY